MIDWAGILGINTFIGGFLGLFVGYILDENFVPKDHGAGTPQHPISGDFKSDDNAFWRWLLVRVSSFIVGAISGNLFGTPMRTIWSSMTEIQQLGVVFILTLLLLASLEQVFQSEVYDG